MAINGRDMVVEKSTDGGTTWTPLACTTEDSFSSEIGEIDVTDKCSNGFKTLLEGGIKSMTISMSGYAKPDHGLLSAFQDGKIEQYRISWAGGGSLEGGFQIASYEETGSNDNSAVEFSAELRSSGAFAFTPSAT